MVACSCVSFRELFYDEEKRLDRKQDCVSSCNYLKSWSEPINPGYRNAQHERQEQEPIQQQ